MSSSLSEIGTEERKYTERDLILAKREAFSQGYATFGDGTERRGYRPIGANFAEKVFPLPKVTRPRVVVDGYWKFRCIDGRIEVCCSEGLASWGTPAPDHTYPAHAIGLTPRRITLLADLLATPNELVEVE